MDELTQTTAVVIRVLVQRTLFKAGLFLS